MPYLRSRDLDKQIQSDNLNQIISSDSGILLLAELAAQEECVSNLVQKYNTASEFTDTNPWSRTLAYNVGARFELNYPVYLPATSYQINDLIAYSGNCYICTAITTGVFDITKWTLLGALYDIFYAKYPYPQFNIDKPYKIGDIVFWNNSVYTCKINTLPIGHNGAIQYAQYASIPSINVFPDNILQGSIYWGVGVPYTVAAGTLPTNAAYIKGDNRSQQLVMYMIDITLYHVHSRIAQRNIPTHRSGRYDAAIAWLAMANSGSVTANIQKLQPLQGRAIRYGGNVKTTNNY